METNLKIGQTIKYKEKEYYIAAIGDWGIRLERGSGDDYCSLVIYWEEL